MRFLEIKAVRTVQAAQYEPRTFEITATLTEGDCPRKCLVELNTILEDSLAGKITAETKVVADNVVATAPVTEEAPKPLKGKVVEDKKEPVSRARNIKYAPDTRPAHKSEATALLGEIAKVGNINFEDVKKVAPLLKAHLVGTNFSKGGVILTEFKEAMSNALDAELKILHGTKVEEVKEEVVTPANLTLIYDTVSPEAKKVFISMFVKACDELGVKPADHSKRVSSAMVGKAIHNVDGTVNADFEAEVKTLLAPSIESDSTGLDL